MFLTILLVILIICVLLLLNIMFIPSYRTYRLVNKLNGPKGYPIIGGTLEVASLKFSELLDYFYYLQTNYPRTSLLWLLGEPLVFFSEPEDLAELFGNTVNLDKGIEYYALRPWLKEGLLLSTGSKWHSRRKLLTPTFHFKILEENLISMQKHAETLVSKLLKSTNQAIDIIQVISLCSLDIISESAMGIQLGAQENPTEEYFHCIKRISEITVFRVQNLYLQRDWLFNLTSQGQEYKKLLKYLHSFTRKIIKERKIEYLNAKKKMNSDQFNEHENESKTKKSHKAFLDLLVEVEGANKLTDDDIQEEVDTFLFEGFDTTSTALTFSIFLLGIYQDVQSKIVEELETIFQGKSGLITNQDLSRMKYLEKFIKESLRLYPAVPYISRKLCQDLILKDGLVIPAGVNAVVMPHFIHRKPDLYPEPEKFDPERFSPENSISRPPYSYIPFSAGPKNCIGQKFAMMELKTILATILRTLKIEPITKLENIEVSPLVILRSVEPIYAKFLPRYKITTL